MRRNRPRLAPLICTMDFNGFPVVMVPVVFALLMILMVWPVRHHAVSIVLPKAHHTVEMPRANREDAMVITVTRDGKVYLRSDRVEPGLLPAKIREYLSTGAERKVYLKVDAMAKYDVVIRALTEVRSTGVEKICFLAERSSPLKFEP